MEKNLEKLFSNVLFQWLRCSQLAEEPDLTDVGFSYGLTAHVLERCLSDAGFSTDMKDFVSEFKNDKGVVL